MSTARTRQASPFQTAAELAFVLPGQEVPSALLINPEAGLLTLLSSMQAKLHLMQQCLKGWYVADPDHDATPEQIVGPALDLAEQIDSLFAEVAQRRADGRTS